MACLCLKLHSRHVLIIICTVLSLKISAGPLHRAASGGDLDKVISLLVGRDWRGNSVDVNELDTVGWGSKIRKSPLECASEHGHVQVVRELIRRGAQPNLQAVLVETGHRCGTPLHTAAAYGHREVVQALIEGGALVNATDDLGHTPLSGMFPRIGGVSQENHQAVIRFLKKAGANFNLGDADGMRPLHKAEMCNERETAKLLRRLGASDRCRTTQPCFHGYYIPRGSTPPDIVEIIQAMNNRALRMYTEALQNRLTDTILAAKTIRSGFVANAAFHPAEAVARGIRGLGTHVPGGAVLAAILEQVAAQDKAMAVRKLAALVPDPAQIHELSRTVASYLVRSKTRIGVPSGETGEQDGEKDAGRILQEVVCAHQPFTDGDVVQNLVRCIYPTFIRPIGWSEWLYRQYMSATSCCRRPKVD